MTGFSDNCKYAMERGYACFQYDCGQVSADNETRTGAFFTLYPYEKDNPTEQRGVLLAWAWGVSKILDALEAGAGKKLGINPALSLVGGVSRYGKSTAVAGAYDERIRVTVPFCSGAEAPPFSGRIITGKRMISRASADRYNGRMNR